MYSPFLIGLRHGQLRQRADGVVLIAQCVDVDLWCNDAVHWCAEMMSGIKQWLDHPQCQTHLPWYLTHRTIVDDLLIAASLCTEQMSAKCMPYCSALHLWPSAWGRRPFKITSMTVLCILTANQKQRQVYIACSSGFKQQWFCRSLLSQ